MKIDVQDVLRVYNVAFTRKNDYCEVICPFHSDSNPSGGIHVSSGSYNCLSCNAKGTIYTFLARTFGKDVRTIYREISTKYYQEKDLIINPIDIERYHIALFQDSRLLGELAHRCVDQETIRHYRLGCASDRITIPIQNAVGQYIFIRSYSPGATANKFTNMRGSKRRVIHLYPIEQLAYDKILLCGGEIKAIAAATYLNKFGIGAISPTCGEKVWESALTAHFTDKIVYVCSDVDATGELSMERRCRFLNAVTAELYKIKLPLDITEYPKGDINDFLRIKGGAELHKLLLEAEPWKLEIPNGYVENEDPIGVDLDAAVTSNFARRRVSFKAVVSSVDVAPYAIPKEVNVACERNQNYCAICSVFINCKHEDQKITIGKERLEILEMVGQPLRTQQAVLKSACGIPPMCKAVSFKTLQDYTIEDARISQPLNHTSRTNDRTMQTAYVLVDKDNRIELNGSYTMTGRMYPHPITQQSTLLISNVVPEQDALSTYKLDNVEPLKIFRPDEWTVESIQNKLDEIYTDFEANVTYIFKRRDLHLAIDLAYHSPLFIQFDNLTEKGWLDILILGDSATGKSQTLKNIRNHYGIGEIASCKSMSVAGLIGGCQKFGSRWFITWGKLPENDGGLLGLEETKGMTTDTISKLTDTRSTGIAEIVKIQRRKTNARTRLIMISNPRPDDGDMSMYNYGIDAVRELIGSPEDIRRFDTVVLLDKREVDSTPLQSLRPTAEHRFTQDLCYDLVLFAWTVEKVIFENEQKLLEYASDLCSNFTDTIPIVDRGSMRFKLARLSAALAVRTLSLGNSDNEILVRECHVEFMFNWLVSQYSKDSYGYKAMSQRLFDMDKLVDAKAVKARVIDIPYAKEFIEACLAADSMDYQFFQDNLCSPPDITRQMISFLLHQRAIKRSGKEYRKTAAFTKLLKTICDCKELSAKPEYLKPEF